MKSSGYRVGWKGEEEIPGHQRIEVRQIDLNAVIIQRQLEAHLNCSTDEETKCTIEPGPKRDLGPPGPQGETGAQGLKGDRGAGLPKMYLVFCN